MPQFFQEQKIFCSEMESPLGILYLAATDRGLCRLSFQSHLSIEQDLRRWSSRKFRKVMIRYDHTQLTPYIDQLNEYFVKKRKSFDLPLDFIGTPFQKRVWEQLQHIPYGQTYSYKNIAHRIGHPKAVRAVGGANNKNPISIIVPCHRVIGSNGSLVGYGAGLPKKQFLLQLEGFLSEK